MENKEQLLKAWEDLKEDCEYMSETYIPDVISQIKSGGSPDTQMIIDLLKKTISKLEYRL